MTQNEGIMILLAWNMMIDLYDILDEITEIRTCCGFREKVIQESTKPHRRSRF